MGLVEVVFFLVLGSSNQDVAFGQVSESGYVAAAANFQSCGRRLSVVQGIRFRRKKTQGQRRAGARLVCQQRQHAPYGAGRGRRHVICV